MTRRIYIRHSNTTAAAEKSRILKQLQDEGDRLLKQLQQQFASTIAREMAQNHGSGSTDAGSDSGSGSGSTGGSSNYSGLVSAATRFLFRSKPKTTIQESTRSRASQQQFRLSQSQAAAEASAALSKAEKNA